MEDLYPSMKRLKRTRITATVGKPFKLEPCGLDSNIDHACLEQGTDEIMCRIAALLPPEYRGEYAEHPRLKELMETETLTRIE
jgi:1-acyl-sn-glycerol-3-phosphate acyltransferase